MFKKLLKYDFKSVIWPFALVWPAALILSVVVRFTVFELWSQSEWGWNVLSGAMLIVFFMVLFAMSVIAWVLAVLRFYKGLLGGEGYLMHTLPVKTWQLIASKLLCASVISWCCGLVTAASVVIALPIELEDYLWFFQEIYRLLGNYTGHAYLFLTEAVVLSLVGTVTGYLRVYLAMGIGHLFNKDRVALSVVAYLVMGGISSFVSRIAMSILSSVLSESDFLRQLLGQGVAAVLSTVHAAVWVSCAFSVLAGAVVFAIVNYILNRKLNLD